MEPLRMSGSGTSSKSTEFGFLGSTVIAFIAMLLSVIDSSPVFADLSLA